MHADRHRLVHVRCAASHQRLLILLDRTGPVVATNVSPASVLRTTIDDSDAAVVTQAKACNMEQRNSVVSKRRTYRSIEYGVLDARIDSQSEHEQSIQTLGVLVAAMPLPVTMIRTNLSLYLSRSPQCSF